MMQGPLVSVIIPAYNRIHLTVRTVDSVLRQTHKNLDIIVVDDGSTDNTPQAMDAYYGQVRYYRKPNGGACSARNVGIREARGEYVAFLDCDDLYLPDKLALSVRFLQANAQYGFVHTAAHFIDDKDKVVGQYSHVRSRRDAATPSRLILGNFVCNSTVVVRREILAQAGLFDETIFTPADWDMWLRLAAVAPGGYLDVPLTMYRVTGNYTFNRLEQARREEEIVLHNYFLRNPRAVLWQRGAAFSNLNLRFAQCHFLKGDFYDARTCLWKAWLSNPHNWKIHAMSLAWVLAPRTLKRKLHSRIIRHEE